MWGNNKFSWEFVVDIPSGEYDLAGNPIRKQKRVSGYKKESEAKKAEFEFLKQLDSGQINLDTKALFKELAQPFLEYIEKSPKYEKGTGNKGVFHSADIITENIEDLRDAIKTDLMLESLEKTANELWKKYGTEINEAAAKFNAPVQNNGTTVE